MGWRLRPRSRRSAVTVGELMPGDVVWARLDPTLGREQGGRRPVVVVASALYLDTVKAKTRHERCGRSCHRPKLMRSTAQNSVPGTAPEISAARVTAAAEPG